MGLNFTIDMTWGRLILLSLSRKRPKISIFRHKDTRRDGKWWLAPAAFWKCVFWETLYKDLMIMISFENRSLSASSHPKEHRDMSLLWPEFHEEQAADEPRLPDATVREVIAPTSQYYHILLHSMNFVRHINSLLNLIRRQLLLGFPSDPNSIIVYPCH